MIKVLSRYANQDIKYCHILLLGSDSTLFEVLFPSKVCILVDVSAVNLVATFHVLSEVSVFVLRLSVLDFLRGTPTSDPYYFMPQNQRYQTFPIPKPPPSSLPHLQNSPSGWWFVSLPGEKIPLGGGSPCGWSFFCTTPQWREWIERLVKRWPRWFLKPCWKWWSQKGCTDTAPYTAPSIAEWWSVMCFLCCGMVPGLVTRSKVSQVCW